VKVSLVKHGNEAQKCVFPTPRCVSVTISNLSESVTIVKAKLGAIELNKVPEVKVDKIDPKKDRILFPNTNLVVEKQH